MKNILITVVSVLAIIVLIFFTLKITKKVQDKKILSLENVISELKEETYPMRFKISKYENEKIEADIYFVDLTDKIVGKKRVNIAGNEFHIDFEIISLGEKDNIQYMFYPKKIFSDIISPENGVNLCAIYDNNGFPAIYKNYDLYLKDKTDQKMKNAYSEKIKIQFECIRNSDNLIEEDQYGSSVHDMRGVSNFKKGAFYTVVCHPHTGAIEIRRD